MVEKALKDPADKIKDVAEEERQFDDLKKLDMASIRISDFKSLPKNRTMYVHPFDGYPIKPAIDIGNSKIKVSPTYIVGLKPTEEPVQDPSGLAMSIINLKTKREEIKDIKTSHSRFIRSGNDSNEDVVFDCEMETADGILHYAVVPRHEIRAQLCYYYDTKTQRFETDKRYLLLDIDQGARLSRLFRDMMRPGIRRDLMAARLSGEVETTEEDLMAVPSEV